MGPAAACDSRECSVRSRPSEIPRLLRSTSRAVCRARDGVVSRVCLLRPLLDPRVVAGSFLDPASSCGSRPLANRRAPPPSLARCGCHRDDPHEGNLCPSHRLPPAGCAGAFGLEIHLATEPRLAPCEAGLVSRRFRHRLRRRRDRDCFFLLRNLSRFPRRERALGNPCGVVQDRHGGWRT